MYCVYVDNVYRDPTLIYVIELFNISSKPHAIAFTDHQTVYTCAVYTGLHSRWLTKNSQFFTVI